MLKSKCRIEKKDSYLDTEIRYRVLETSKYQNQNTQQKPSTRDAMLNGVAVASLDQAKEIGRNIENTEPLIEVPAQTEFQVLFSGE